MKTTTSPPEVRTRTAEATEGTTRRRAVRQPDAVQRARTGTPATGRGVATRTPERRATAPTRRPVGRPATTAPQAPFAVLVVGLLGGALVGLLLLNTALAQQSFTRSELQRENQRLEERRQALQEDVARENGPEALHAKARRLGMRDAEQPVPIAPSTLAPSATPSR